jgi:hypothetical protein
MTLADRLFRELVFCDVEAALVPDGAEPSRHFFPELLVHLIQRRVGQRERFDRALRSTCALTRTRATANATGFAT